MSLWNYKLGKSPNQGKWKRKYKDRPDIPDILNGIFRMVFLLSFFDIILRS
jgi:hypothetical protein